MSRRHRLVRAGVSALAVLTLLGPPAVAGAPVESTAPARPEAVWQTRGPGHAEASARATSSGRIVVDTRARATRTGRPAVARAVASVSERFAVGPGTCRVRLTYAGISSRRREQGRDAVVAVRRRSVVEFASTAGGGASGVRRVQSVPRSGAAVTLVEVDVFPGSRGRLEATAELYARSAARGTGDRATAGASVRDVRISVTRLS